MNNRARLVLFAITGLIGAMLLWQTARGMYFEPRRQLLERLEQAEEDIRVYQNKLDERPRLQRQLDDVVKATLGSDLETVDHLFRTRLNRIAEQTKLDPPTVATKSSTTRRSPAYQLFRARTGIQRELRETIDFVELDGSIAAEGTLAQIIELLDRIEAEPWLKRVHDVRLSPSSRSNGERFAATIRLQTLFLPNASMPEDANSAGSHHGDYDSSRLSRFALLVDSNPFRLPPPPKPEVDKPAPATPSGPPRFPYGQWLLTGVAESPTNSLRVEVWLLNRSSGERRVLMPGETVGEAVFVAIRGDEAIFEIGESQFLVQVGGHLDHRTPVKK